MKTVLKSAKYENNILVKTFKKDFKSSGFKEIKHHIENNYEKGTLIEIQLNGTRVIIRDIKIKDYTIDVFHDFPFFKLQFEIEGNSHYTPLNNLSTEVFIPNGHYNLFYLPEVNGVLNYKTNYRKTLEIIFTENYIKKIIGKNFKETFSKFGDAITEKKPFLMWEKSKPISLELQSHINEIINCNYINSIKQPYLEAKINELLISLLALTNDDSYKKVNIDLPKNDYINILKIETYIKNNLKYPITIPELALIAGMNTSKLKLSFKVVFSSTIFKHTTKLRMEKAKELITNKGYTVTEASLEVGYKHSQHFTVAFKKLYGFLPSKLI